MARNRTLLQLREEVYKRADVHANFIATAEMNDMINNSIAELYDLLVTVNKDYYLDSDTVSVVSGTDEYALPSDFFKVMGVDVEDGGSTYSLYRFNFAERNMFQTSSSSKSTTRYRIMGDNLRLSPTPAWSGNITLWYIPAPAILTLDGDTFDGIAGWEEYVVVDCVIKIRSKREEDSSIEEAQKKLLYSRIMTSAPERDDSEPDRVRDVYRERWGTNFNRDY